MSLPYKDRRIPQYTAASHRHVMVFFGARDAIGTGSREGPQLAHSVSAEGPKSTHCDPTALSFNAHLTTSPTT
jgi:hypothetical protein